MAQHRTRDDKIKAQIQRTGQAKQYSLADLPIENIPLNNRTSSRREVETFGVNMKAVRADLTRTAISTLVILAFLTVGFFVLR